MQNFKHARGLPLIGDSVSDKPIKTVVIPDKYFEGLKESDDWAVFKAWKAMRRDVANSKLMTYNETLEQLLMSHPLVTDYIRRSQYHCTFKYGQSPIISYYPTKGKWVVSNKTYNGGFDSMIGFMRKKKK